MSKLWEESWVHAVSEMYIFRNPQDKRFIWNRSKNWYLSRKRPN
uniref:Uncharacterized protein n=1 Tax=Nelumbo nucifera TaxID=4432 RepID=A0A822YJL6_NELNU|nr:TPA_asm: hypothetical protein HUJ06_011621 [Nelumbo nucifera]